MINIINKTFTYQAKVMDILKLSDIDIDLYL